ncbi:hypothetical protein HPB50_024263 [Hyalomma asiaticum]|uniref:Uncharacterized protein n=1 Tax=Hyalomma asiaticum TaxID=266040 RepID=A0ACB7SBT6_HYAAI|nr:hypothetical protein HPB50_024263 [Hyalomma asiaticum]
MRGGRKRMAASRNADNDEVSERDPVRTPATARRAPLQCRSVGSFGTARRRSPLLLPATQPPRLLVRVTSHAHSGTTAPPPVFLGRAPELLESPVAAVRSSGKSVSFLTRLEECTRCRVDVA